MPTQSSSKQQSRSASLALRPRPSFLYSQLTTRNSQLLLRVAGNAVGVPCAALPADGLHVAALLQRLQRLNRQLASLAPLLHHRPNVGPEGPAERLLRRHQVARLL